MVAISYELCFILLIYRGQKFREAFKMICGIRALTGASFMALTTSAPARVTSEIIESLDLKSPRMVNSKYM